MIYKKNFNMMNILMVSIMMFSLIMINFIESKFMLWFFMEMSSLTFIGILNYSNMNKTPSLLYFVISSICSMILLMTILLTENYLNMMMYKKLNNLLQILITLIMFVKLGLYPFHSWMLFIFPQISWFSIFLFSTINKMIPIYIMSTMMNFNDFLLFMIMINSITTSILSMTMTSFKKIMAFSSMIHTSYLMIFLMLNPSSYLIYASLYLINSLMLMTFLHKFNINSPISLMNSLNFNSFNYLYIALILSYSMLPPMFFFTSKWLFFNEMITLKINFFLFIMTLSSIGITWSYLNMLNMKLINNKYLMKNYFKQKSLMKFYSLLMFLSILINFTLTSLMIN
uniref:NADH-ubiquinone oxidoreductase chain 2 n=1 Tax=Coelioxys fenestrata TaxID=621226 RepID=A0A7T4WNV3_9HYME|nr:NADH dehydrogenase subunit 2 [Coelioxys fenestrata]QQD78143.1 NADH dehydrogenase subunit 2 [Coelioxys fenestrata]